jgi:hypothetical protein
MTQGQRFTILHTEWDYRNVGGESGPGSGASRVRIRWTKQDVIPKQFRLIASKRTMAVVF